MIGPTFGDLSQAMALRRHGVSMRQALDSLGQQVATGKKQDISRALGGDLGGLTSIDQSLKRMEGWKIAVTEADLLLGAAQRSLEAIQTETQGFGIRLMSQATNPNRDLVKSFSDQSLAKLDTTLSALNMRVADRAIFSGVATGTSAVPDARSLLDQIVALTAADTTPQEVEATVTAYFAAGPGVSPGFVDDSYLGADTALAPFVLGGSGAVNFDITAADPALRETLKGLVLASLPTRDTPSGDLADKAALLRIGGLALQSADDGLTGLRARVGGLEAQVEGQRVANEAEGTALKISRGALTNADPYESAVAMTEAENRLQALYTVTARLSRLSLSEYLR